MLLPQPVIDPLRCVALLSGHFAVRFQPLVDDGDIIFQHRITLGLDIRQAIFTPVLLVGIFSYRLEAVPRLARNFAQTDLFIFVLVFDILYLSHS